MQWQQQSHNKDNLMVIGAVATMLQIYCGKEMTALQQKQYDNNSNYVGAGNDSTVIVLVMATVVTATVVITMMQQ